MGAGRPEALLPQGLREHQHTPPPHRRPLGPTCSSEHLGLARRKHTARSKVRARPGPPLRAPRPQPSPGPACSPRPGWTSLSRVGYFLRLWRPESTVGKGVPGASVRAPSPPAAQPPGVSLTRTLLLPSFPCQDGRSRPSPISKSSKIGRASCRERVSSPV